MNSKLKNLRHFRSRLGLPEGYRTGSVTQAVETTRLNQTDLSPFLVINDFTPVAGVVTISDTAYILDFYSDTSRSSDIISYQEISSRLRDPQTAPTTTDLVAYIINGGLMVYPTTLTKVYVVYYREPVDPVFRIQTNITTHEMEYNSSGSTELEWDDGNKLDIMHMILNDMGINISRAEVTQYATKTCRNREMRKDVLTASVQKLILKQSPTQDSLKFVHPKGC